MRDLRSSLIMRDDDVAFIKNNRGDDPRLVFGIVVAVGDNSIDVEDEEGVLHNVRFTQRSMLADKMLNVVTIPARPDVYGSVLDCSGHPILYGDLVAFMETPSQGFSTGLLIGEAVKVEADGVTIAAKTRTAQRYMRPPRDVIVIKHSKSEG